MLYNCLSIIYNYTLLDVSPVRLARSLHVPDWLTILFCAIFVLLTLIIVLGRRKFKFIVRALYSPQDRSQLLRESKPLGEWIYAFLLLYIFIVQGLFFFLVISKLFPDAGAILPPSILLTACIAAFTADYFLKRAMVFILTHIFDCPEDRNTFKQNKFFHLVVNSLALFPLLLIAAYSGHFPILFVYAPIFAANYATMIYRTLTLKSQQLHIFQLFLYFCTLEILPILIIIKLLLLI